MGHDGVSQRLEDEGRREVKLMEALVWLLAPFLDEDPYDEDQ